jgi:soluble lytic murein transglycosylase
MAAARKAPEQGIRHIKAVFPEYLLLKREAAPQRFWKHAFPFPWRDQIEKESRARGLDPFLVAALIRQESEFDARAVSRARAHGLMQMMPSTARANSRKLGIKRFRTAMLFDPPTNIRFGTFYLNTLLEGTGGRIDTALAAYNAGKRRVVDWLERAEYREPAEFIEDIPFSETRSYVQIVLRNAALYRELYSGRD